MDQNIEKIKEEILEGEIVSYDELPEQLQNDREVILELALNSYGETLLEMPEDCIWRKDKEIVMAGVERYLMDLNAHEDMDPVAAWDLVDKSLQQDEDLVNLIGEEAP